MPEREPQMSERLLISDISDADVDAVVDLWTRAGLTRPWNDPGRDIAFARQSAEATVLVGRETPDGAIVAAVMAGHDGHRGAVYYVAVDPARQGGGLGREIMAAAERWLKDRGVWKLNLMVRTDNTAVAAFYRSLGYEFEERLNFSRWLDPSAKPST